MTGTIAAIARRHARERGNALAFAFLSDGAADVSRLTFAELDARAEATAAAIREVAEPGDRALLIHEAGLEFVTALLGCLYAGVVAVPLPAPEASRMKGSNARLGAVVRDSGARLLIGTDRTRPLMRDDSGLHILRAIEDGAVGVAGADEPHLEQLAYLQYTSGSTSSPKGVMVSHGNIVRHLAGMQAALGYDDASVSVCWMPHFHDYGLVEGILLPLFNGTPSYLLSPFSFLKRPASWLDAITRYRGTHTQAFNFAYRYCTRRVTAAQRAALDLSSLRSAGNGGEPIHGDTSEEFFQAFSTCGLQREALAPVFGLAEATLLVSAVGVTAAPRVTSFDVQALASGRILARTARDGTRRIASCGPLLPETIVAIVNPESRRRAQGDEVGEIWVNAPGVAGGYWQREHESGETFRARIDGEDDGLEYMRTGDLGFMHRDELYISAREKDLIIVHGLNHYPQDIEWTVQRAHPLLRADNGAAFSIDVGGEERLCLIQEIERGAHTAAELEAVMASVATAVVEQHGLPLYGAMLIRRASIPKTTSGKIKRRSCRDRYLDETLDIVFKWPMTPGSALMRDTPASDSSARQADELIAWMRDYGERRINSRLIDERRTLPPNIVLDFGNRGLFGLQVPEQYGGLALRTVDTLRVYMQLAAIDPTIATLVFLHNTNGIRPILHHATPSLRAELLPILARGRELAAFTLSEPGAGSSLGGIGTSATPDGDSWRIDGEKRWNGSAWCGVMSVFARLMDAEGRARGLCGFVVRQSDKGVEIGPESLTMGIRGIVQNSVRFDDVRVSADRVLGEPGSAMRVVDDVLSHGRLATAAVALGIALRSAQLILRYASRREVETGLLLENPQASVAISALVHRIDIGRALLLHCAEGLDAGNAIIPAVAMAIKVSSTDTGNHAADLMVQLLGGRGYMESNLAPQLFRDARMLSIGEGANEGLVAAIGRGVRLADSLQHFLATLDATGAVHGRLMVASGALDGAARSPDLDDAAAQAWRDALRGRLAIAALELATAMGKTGTGEAVLYARARFDRLCHDAEHGSADLAAMLRPDHIREHVDTYRELIGDVEPLAPDVDYTLDPLLRRDRRAAEPVRTTGESLDDKKERLRRLLVERRQGT